MGDQGFGVRYKARIQELSIEKEKLRRVPLHPTFDGESPNCFKFLNVLKDKVTCGG
jgi:hypothetical protein